MAEDVTTKAMSRVRSATKVRAFHEAGHAIVAHCLDFVVCRVSIRSSGKTRGICEYGLDPDEPLDDPGVREWWIKARATVSRAGALAEERAGYKPGIGCVGDAMEAERLIAELAELHPDDWDYESRLHDHCCARADAILTKHWEVVETIAAALLENRVLNGRQFMRLMLMSRPYPSGDPALRVAAKDEEADSPFPGLACVPEYV